HRLVSRPFIPYHSALQSPPFPYTTLFRSSCGGVPRSHTCGFGIALIVELIDVHARDPRICASSSRRQSDEKPLPDCLLLDEAQIDRKSTRLNSSHVKISYAVCCLKKKKRE